LAVLVTSDPAPAYLDEVLHRHVGPTHRTWPRVRRADLDALLADDTRQRLAHTRLAATEWGAGEAHHAVEITTEHGMLTPHGLVYAAGMIAGPHRTLYYLATPDVLFEPLVDDTAATPLPGGSAVAVDGRLDRDLVFSWPLDAALRHLLDAYEALRLTGPRPPTPPRAARRPRHR
jgi:hypothetical protein